jgi:hypothetical protein
MKIDLFVRAVREPKKVIKKNRKKENNVIFHVYAGAEPRNSQICLVLFMLKWH